MKKNLLKLSCYVLLLAFTSCSSCKKDNPSPESQLPAATQTGANTAGALIDGVAWIPNGAPWSGIKPIRGGYISIQGIPKYSVSLRMSYNSEDGKIRNSMNVFVQSVDKLGRYPLSFDTGTDLIQPNTKSFGLYTSRGYFANDPNDPDYKYITTSIKTGYVNFTMVDTTNKLLAGTFEFDAIDNPSGKTIKVTGGRFDINQITLNR